jgi:hypothetical protein
MARIRGLEKSEAPLLARPFYFLLRRMFGKDLTPYKIQARRPGILWLGSLLGVAIEKSGRIEERVHLLAHLYTARLIGCPF